MTKVKPNITSSKPIPQRTCIACRKTGAKRGLVRLVNNPGVGVEVDPGGKKPGRGAYLCYSFPCWEGALKTARLAQALRTEISSENRINLLKYAGTLENRTAQA